jgi:heme exporter protein A
MRGGSAVADLHASGAGATEIVEGALEVSSLVRRFGDREALRAVTSRLALGETLVVFGPNGAGKTTFLRVLATLLLPHAGSVRVLGRSLPEEAQQVRARVGFATHEALLYRDLTGRENLAFYARLYTVDDARERIEELLGACDMQRRADEPIRSLSRGMVQRLAICRAVLHRPELLLLDEPRAGLDPDAAELIEPLIGRASGLTRVLVTHDVVQGLAEADRVLGLRDGRQVLESATANVDTDQVLALYRGPARTALGGGQLN